MRVNRLLEMVTLLLNRQTITAGEFAERFNISVRTVYRDVEDLSSAGIPVYMSKGKGGGISLLEDFTLNKTLISRQETDSLLLALRTLQAVKYPDVDRFLEKLQSLFHTSAPSDWVLVEFSPWGSKPDDEQKFTEIKMAILSHKVVAFDYINSRGEKSRREVEPSKLIFKGQAWYLHGYCRSQNAFRTFRISRIKNQSVSPEVFQPRIEHEEEIKTEQRKNYIPVRLRFSRNVRYRVYDDFDEASIIRNPDGSCDVVFSFPEDEWLYSYLLSFGPGVEVLEPDFLRGRLADRLKETLEIYR
ncbi:DeoR family transcriptional regulator [Leptolinea sp. HRD-7]|nr:DeoR family transcriptional regulator [Leptolinea sp. HRD-7]